VQKVMLSEHFALSSGAVQGICASKGVYLATHIEKQSGMALAKPLKTMGFDAIQLGNECAHLPTSAATQVADRQPNPAAVLHGEVLKGPIQRLLKRQG
jgi:hypothetical protein